MPTKPDVPARTRDAAELIGSCYALPGTLASRFIRCEKTNCRCKAEPPLLHNPYLHWTRTVAGKTVTRTLTLEQAERYQPWFDNARRLREALTELEAQSLKAFLDAGPATTAHSVAVPRRVRPDKVNWCDFDSSVAQV